MDSVLMWVAWAMSMAFMGVGIVLLQEMIKLVRAITKAVGDFNTAADNARKMGLFK